jgi:hypothetical protein
MGGGVVIIFKKETRQSYMEYLKLQIIKATGLQTKPRYAGSVNLNLSRTPNKNLNARMASMINRRCTSNVGGELQL